MKKKKVLFFAFALSLMVSMGMAQVNEAGPYVTKDFQSLAPSNSSTRGLGDHLWAIDVETPTGDIRCLGVEFDGTDFWVTGAFDFSIAYLHQLDSTGAWITSYPQPSGNWGYWGWRDLGYDGTYLYAGDDSNMPGYITQIDPATGSMTGTFYGPFPVVPCRAMGYDSNDDSFWTGSWSSSFYHCFRDGSYTAHTNPSLAGIYGCASEESSSLHMLWWWTQDGNGELASQFDPLSATLTGVTFDGVGGGLAGGACAYDQGGGQWILVGMSQASPDTIHAYDLETVSVPLKANVTEFNSWEGADITFYLDAGIANAGRYFIILCSASGSSPGTMLPGGTILPMNWDWVTTAVIVAYPGLFGQLDKAGQATAKMFIPHMIKPPGHPDIPLTFAYPLEGPPWDFASNNWDIIMHCPELPPDEYYYDDGSSENLLGWTAGGEMCWMHYFEVPAAGTDTIESVSTAFGSPVWPGYGPGNGSPAEVFIWEDPTNNMDPYDCVYLDGVGTTVANVDTDIFNVVMLNSAQTVTDGFWVGANLDHAAGQYVAPIDMDTGGYIAQAWVAGDPGGTGGGFDEFNIGNNGGVYEMGTGVGLPNFFLLRAQPQ